MRRGKRNNVVIVFCRGVLHTPRSYTPRSHTFINKIFTNYERHFKLYMINNDVSGRMQYAPTGTFFCCCVFNIVKRYFLFIGRIVIRPYTRDWLKRLVFNAAHWSAKDIILWWVWMVLAKPKSEHSVWVNRFGFLKDKTVTSLRGNEKRAQNYPCGPAGRRFLALPFVLTKGSRSR